MPDDSDTLLYQTANGNKQSFKSLYDMLAPRLLAFLMRMLGDRHLAEDILQETMLQTWRKASEFDANKSKASTWIIAIARNRALDQLRKSGRFNQVVKDDEYKISQVLFQDNSDLEANTVSRKTSGLLMHCMGEIGDEPAACIQLAYINGFSISEIADFRDRSIHTVKSWVRRGLVKLEECMQR